MMKNSGKTGFCILLAATMISCVAQRAELYKSSVFTPKMAFTNGCEGPAVDKDGTIYAVNFKNEGTIGKITMSGQPELYVELPRGSTGNGIRFNSKGDMFIADYTGHNILKVETATKMISVYAHEPRMTQPNDVAIDSKDRIYASDPNFKAGSGRIWRVDTDGTVSLLDSIEGAANGIDLSPDEKTFYVNAGHKLFAYDLSAAGELSNRRQLIDFGDFGVDGMRCDADGNIYVARFGKGVVAKVSPKGELLKEIPLTGKKSTNVAFGGKDGRTVYVTLMDNGNLESFKVETPGREWKMMH